MANGNYRSIGDIPSIPTFSTQDLFQGGTLSPQGGFVPLPTFNSPQTTTPPPSTGFSILGQGGSNIATGLKGLGSIGSAYAAYKQYQLGKDQLASNRAAFNRNLENQAAITNAQIEDRELRRAAQRSDLAGDFQAIQDAANRSYNQRKISGEPI